MVFQGSYVVLLLVTHVSLGVQPTYRPGVGLLRFAYQDEYVTCPAFPLQPFHRLALGLLIGIESSLQKCRRSATLVLSRCRRCGKDGDGQACETEIGEAPTSVV